MTESQKSLSEFSPTDGSTMGVNRRGGSPTEQSGRDDGSSTSESTTTESARPTRNDSPLSEFYGDVSAFIEENYPAVLRDHRHAIQLQPDTYQYRTRDLPEGVDALPDTIGSWRLATHDATHVSYLTDGPAFSIKYGEGGALSRIILKLNDRGANRDGKYHLSREAAFGYTNGDSVRAHTPDSKKPILGIRGHSAADNPGDGSVLGGTIQKFDDARTGLLELVAQLHHTPAPVLEYITGAEQSPWNLDCNKVLHGMWVTDAPDTIDKERLKLSLFRGSLRLAAYDPGDSARDKQNVVAPIVDSTVPSGLQDWLDSDTFCTLPAIHATNAIFAEELQTVVAKSDLPTRQV